VAQHTRHCDGIKPAGCLPTACQARHEPVRLLRLCGDLLLVQQERQSAGRTIRRLGVSQASFGK
jgi:hypothetical protein